MFSFDERISEQGVEDAVSVSPRTSPVAVDRSRTGIRVSLRRGWEAGRIYQVRVGRTVRDLFGNSLAAPLEVVFSTGPPIPDTRISGTVRDRITGQPQPNIRVEAIHQPDSLVYTVPTDSAGGWALRRIPAGPYQVRAFRDLNQNRALDAFEARDTATLQVAGAVANPVQLSLLAPDSTPPKLGGAAVSGEEIELRFDDYLAPAQPLSPALVQLSGPGGATVPVAAVRLGSAAPAAPPPVARDTAGQDTAAADSAAPAPPDSARASQAPVAPAQPSLPAQTLVLRPASPLAPGARYRVRVQGVRNVNGLVGGGEVEFSAPAASAGRP